MRKQQSDGAAAVSHSAVSFETLPGVCAACLWEASLEPQVQRNGDPVQSRAPKELEDIAAGSKYGPEAAKSALATPTIFNWAALSMRASLTLQASKK